MNETLNSSATIAVDAFVATAAMPNTAIESMDVIAEVPVESIGAYCEKHHISRNEQNAAQIDNHVLRNLIAEAIDSAARRGVYRHQHIVQIGPIQAAIGAAELIKKDSLPTHVSDMNVKVWLTNRKGTATSPVAAQ